MKTAYRSMQFRAKPYHLYKLDGSARDHCFQSADGLADALTVLSQTLTLWNLDLFQDLKQNCNMFKFNGENFSDSIGYLIKSCFRRQVDKKSFPILFYTFQIQDISQLEFEIFSIHPSLSHSAQFFWIQNNKIIAFVLHANFFKKSSL